MTRDYLFKGYSPRSESANGTLSGVNVSFWSVMRGNRLVKASYNGAGWIMVPGLVARSLSSVPLGITSTKDEDGSVLVRLGDKAACQPFTMNDRWNAERYIPDGACGSDAEFRLDRYLHFQNFAYEATGLPIPARIYPFGDCTLQRYHTEIEFQTTTIPGDTEPFLLPKRVTTTLETNKGNLVINSMYEP